jgi:hypothetical protein
MYHTYSHRRPFHNKKIHKYSHQGDRYNYKAEHFPKSPQPVQHRYGFPTTHNANTYRRQLPVERQSGLIPANPVGYALAVATLIGLVRVIGVSTIFDGVNPWTILNGKYIKS